MTIYADIPSRNIIARRLSPMAHGGIARELLPINTDGYSPIILNGDENYRVLGVLRYVIP